MNSTSLLSATVQRARQAYPSLPYHNTQHMDDVVQMTKELIHLVPRYTFSAQQQELLVIAAAWHDAGYDHAAAKEYWCKEAYSVALFVQDSQREGLELDSEAYAFVERAILGTIVVPPLQRSTLEAKLLHLADIGFLFADWQTFWRGTMAYRVEEQPDTPWVEFLQRQQRFFAICLAEMQTDGLLLGIAPSVISQYCAALQQHMEQFVRMPEPVAHTAK